MLESAAQSGPYTISASTARHLPKLSDSAVSALSVRIDGISRNVLTPLIATPRLHSMLTPSVQWLSRVFQTQSNLVIGDENWLIVDVPVDRDTACELLVLFGERIAVDRRMLPAHIAACLTQTKFCRSLFEPGPNVPVEPMVPPNWISLCCGTLNGSIVPHILEPVRFTGRSSSFVLRVSTENVIEARKGRTTAVVDSTDGYTRLAVKIGPVSVASMEEAHVSRALSRDRYGGYWVPTVSDYVKLGWHALVMEHVGHNVYHELRNGTVPYRLMGVIMCEILAAIGIEQMHMSDVVGCINMDWRTSNVAIRTNGSKIGLPVCLFDAGLVATSVSDLMQKTNMRKGPVYMFEWMNANMSDLVSHAKRGQTDPDIIGLLDRLQRKTTLHTSQKDGICLEDEWQNVLAAYSSALYQFSTDLWRAHGALLCDARTRLAEHLVCM